MVYALNVEIPKKTQSLIGVTSVENNKDKGIVYSILKWDSLSNWTT